MFQRTGWLFQLSGFMLGLLFLLGCGGAQDKRTKIIVKGNLTVDGKGMGGVSLSFYPANEKSAVATVSTQDDGNYEVMFMTHVGEGNYKVTASKNQGKSGKSIQKSEGIDDYQLQVAAGASGPTTVNLLPDKYSTPDKSELTVVLQTGMNEGKNLAIKTK